jgi:hypothetical protein
MDGTLEEKKAMVASRMGIIKTMKDSKVCKQCAEAAASGKFVAYPLHPNCRCKSAVQTA